MVHNGVEYGLMQAYAEGFDVFDKCEFELDNAKIAHLWGQGSVVRSWLCELAARAFEADGNALEKIEGYTADSGEGRWTIEDATAHDVPTPVITASLYARFRSRGNGDFADRVLAALRNQFGGHAVKSKRQMKRPVRRTDRAGLPENPLVEGLERLPVAPTTLVLFGATGDLAKRKLLPALYNLAHEGALPERFHLVGVSRKDKADEDYREECEQAIRRFSRRRPDEDVLRGFLENVKYVPGEFDEESVYAELSQVLDGFDREAGEALNRAFYLSTAPNFFPLIVAQLGERGLARHDDAEVRVIIEKPFGTSLAEALELNRQVLDVFEETQVFRIDHYLGKETVQNMMAFRFANGMFEPLWNRNYIDSVQITAAEDIGIGTRAGFYDQTGALRDLIQNHMLQLLCHVAMEPPVSFTAEEVRNEKVKVLHAIHAPRVEEVPRDRGARAVRRRALRRRGRAGLPRRGGRARGLEDRDVRGAALGSRQLALGRRALLPARGQAPGAQDHRDRGHAEARPPSRLLPGRVFGGQTQPAGAHAPAQRGRDLAARREDPGLAHADPLGEHGVPVRHLLHVPIPGGLRAADHGRDARRPDFVHPQRRGRGAVAHLRSRPAGVGERGRRVGGGRWAPSI